MLAHPMLASLSIRELLDPRAVLVPLKAVDRQGVLDELCDALGGTGAVSDVVQIKKAVWEREQQRSTGIGEGLAFPHGKCGSVVRPAIAVGRPSVPMDFGAIDRRPIRLIVLLASPPDRISDHIQVLHLISRIFSDAATRERICLAPDPVTLRTELLAAESAFAARGA
ncbi:MAG: PTS sugar transporter subunit IIA [Planctomycetes bacterium]|nr:PTS sugar transporter subunit IIA [Planctomycetota bacterium]